MIIRVLCNSQITEEIDLSQEKHLQREGEKVTFLIGRSSQCHIVLDDIRVSREHAELILENSLWKIRQRKDNATLTVSGVEIKEKVLIDGDTISLGIFTLQIILSEKEKRVVKEQSEIIDNSPHEAMEEEAEVKAVEESIIQEEETGDESDEYLQEDTDEESEEVFDEFSDEDNTKIYKGFSLHSLEIFGENAPYDNYTLEESETFIGRDPKKCQIVLSDHEVSSIHAVVKKTGSSATLEDLQSSNGTLLNGKRINSAQLENGSEFVIGSTTFTYKAVLEILKKEEDRLMPVEENQSIEVEEILEVDGNIDDLNLADNAQIASSSSLFSKDALKDPEKRKKILMIVVALVGLWVLLDKESPPPKQVSKREQKQKKEEKRDATQQTIDEGPKLTKEQKIVLDQHYLLAKAAIEQGKYQETLFELEKVFQVVDDWKEAKQIKSLAEEGLALIEEQERKRKKEEERRRIALKVKALVTKAKEAVKERKEHFAQAIFGDILKLEPDNYDVLELKRELQFWKDEQEKKRLEEAAKKIAREKKEKALKPGKNYYTQKKWYRAILQFEKFLKIQDMDDDLILEGTTMLQISQQELVKITTPLLGSARALKRGQDLKGAYESYNKILFYNPGHEESLNEINRINSTLERRSRSVFIKGLIAENLSLFKEAKEKFQEVQQISPSDSAYYKKASDRLKKYFDEKD